MTYIQEMGEELEMEAMVERAEEEQETDAMVERAGEEQVTNTHFLFDICNLQPLF